MDGAEAMLQRITSVLRAKRYRFYPNKNYGSLLDIVDCAPYEKYALCYAQQAVSGLDGVTVEDATAKNGGFVFKVRINRKEYEVSTQGDL